MKKGIFFEVGAAGQYLRYLLEDNWKDLVYERERNEEPMFIPTSFTEIYDNWTGYFIEPLPQHIALMLEWHKTHLGWDAHYVQCAISGKNKLEEMSVIKFLDDDRQMSTLSGTEFYQDWARYVNSFWVQTLTLDTLFSGLDAYPDLLRIDIEGAEIEALEAYSFNPPPRIVQIDHHGNIKILQKILERHNYKIVTDTFLNFEGHKDFDIYAEFNE